MNSGIRDDVYDNRRFTLKYPSVDAIIGTINQLDGNLLLSKIVLSRAFCILHIDPYDFDIMGMLWKGSTYLDIRVPISMRLGSTFCQHVTDIICHIMSSKWLVIFNYIDDIICRHSHKNADAEFCLLYSLFEYLGLPMNPKKVVPPARILTCMGIVIDIDAGLTSIPQDKCLQILDLCQNYVRRKCIIKKQL